jgi:hypothetical protein
MKYSWFISLFLSEKKNILNVIFSPLSDQFFICSLYSNYSLNSNE